MLFLFVLQYYRFSNLTGAEFTDSIVCLIHFHQCKSGPAYIFLIAPTLFVCRSRLAGAFFFNKCFSSIIFPQYLLYLAFKYRLHYSFMIYQTLWTHHLEQLIQLINPELIHRRRLTTQSRNHLPIGFIKCGYTLTLPASPVVGAQNMDPFQYPQIFSGQYASSANFVAFLSMNDFSRKISKLYFNMLNFSLVSKFSGCFDFTSLNNSDSDRQIFAQT